MEDEPIKLWINLSKDNLYLTYGNKIVTISAQMLWELFIGKPIDKYITICRDDNK